MTRKLPPEPAAGIPNIRHGLVARTLAIPGLEHPRDWRRFRKGIVRGLAPEGPVEEELALTVAECMWRRRRVARQEQQLVAIERQRDGAKQAWKAHKEKIEAMEAQELAGQQPRDAAKVQTVSRMFYGDLIAHMRIDGMIAPEPIFPPNADLDRLIRYEAHLARQLYHALHELQALQSMRRGEPAPLARVSVLGSGA